MNPEIKVKWIAALRSGKYKRTKGRLKHRGRHCCLGVLCEVLRIKPAREDDVWVYDESSEVLPFGAQRASGVGRAGELKKAVNFRGGVYQGLAELNDAGADFNFIADVIEKQL